MSRQRTVALLLAPVAAGAAVAAVRRGSRRGAPDPDRPGTDIGFMRAIHAAFRRDLTRLLAVAPDVDQAGKAAQPVLDGWVSLRDTLDQHHSAEDDNLWPVLRRHLTRAEDFRAVQAMVDDHRNLPPAMEAVDTALAKGQGVTSAAGRLAGLVNDHLDHEERAVFPLLEQHLSRREWRAFLVAERNRRPFGTRPEFLTWVLDQASDRDTAAVLGELPRPAHTVYRRVLRPRYEAKHRWQQATATGLRSGTSTTPDPYLANPWLDPSLNPPR